LTDIAMVAEDLGKKYYIGQTAVTRRGVYDAVTHALFTPFRRAGKMLRGEQTSASELNTEFWAVRNISFQIHTGEVVGIIGRNGAGKSTLLKLLSRITSPTEGKIFSYGRVASLLEVGTGFHPELTGRENVYLNGAILGMNRHEIERKFDEIVAFAEVEKFIDTPVKHYSSGMYIRLGFSVAAHLEPDILIIDEVLSVGDASFQKKCLSKMEGESQSGRTVLFVSHSMASISRLCSRTILLDEGNLVHDGPTHETIKVYLQSDSGTSARRDWTNASKLPGTEVVRLRSAQARTEDGKVLEAFDIRKPIAVEIEYDVLQPGHKLVPNFHFYNQEGSCIFISSDSPGNKHPKDIGRYTSTVWIPGNLLAEGQVLVNVAITTYAATQVHFHEREAIVFQIVDSIDGDSVRGHYAGDIPGVVRPLLKWENQYSTFNDISSIEISSTLPQV
jgi:lipopolysaccharide transport system ATP-binding protein